MKNLFILLCAVLIAVSLSPGQAFAIGYCKDALEAGNPGGPAGAKTFDDSIQLAEDTQVCIDIWVNDIPNPTLLTTGFWITYDPAVLQLDSFIVYTIANGGPWDNAGTTIVPNPAGPGTYFGTTVQFSTVPIDAGGDIIAGKICVTCLDGREDTTITITTIPGFDTIVGDSIVFDFQVVENTLAIDQFWLPCICTITPNPVTVAPSAINPVTQQFTVSESARCVNPPDYVWSDTCALGSVDQTGLLTVPPTLVGESCTVCVTDTANTGIQAPVSCCAEVEILPCPCCQTEIALGRECPGEAVDDPAYNRPGRRGLAATCNDVIDFTVCSDCYAFDPACLVWTVTPPLPGGYTFEQIDTCCWRLTIGDSCQQLDKIATYTVTVTDTCNNSSDSVEIDVGKVIVDIGDTTVQPNTESATVDINCINPEHHVRAISLDVAQCNAQNDNLVCTECVIDPARALDFTCSANEQADGSCRVVVYSTNPAALITQGTGTIAEIIYQAGPGLTDLCGPDACIDLCPKNVSVSDQFNEDLCTCPSAGEVCFRTCGDIYPQDCLGGPCGQVTCCGDGVVDLFDILEAVDIILNLQVATACQIGNGDVPNGMPPYCGNPPGDPNCETDGDIDIFDVLVMIDRALGKMNCCDYCLFGQIF